MASIRREVPLGAAVDEVWDAIRDVGALHRRLVPGFVVDCRLEGEARIVTFASGLVARELIVDLDDAQRRLCWSAVGGRLSHHNASVQALADGADGCRVVWIADLLPNSLAPAVDAMIEQGLRAMQQRFDRGGARAG
jgi:Polyketide cyclase / dehydrase and lipid transport